MRATAPKSNSIMGFFDALAAVEIENVAEVPTHLKDANRDKKGFGHGAGYLYPHAYRDHWVEQQYLPKSLQGQLFYQPSIQKKLFIQMSLTPCLTGTLMICVTLLPQMGTAYK
ncbi:MAG: AAA family ATPase [Nostoc sp.]